MSYNEEIKTGWYKLITINSVNASPIKDDNICLAERPDNTKEFTGGEQVVLKLVFTSNCEEDETVILDLIGFRKGSTLAEYLGTITLTGGASTFTVNPGSGKAIAGRMMDTIAVGTDNWSVSSVSLLSASPDSGNDRFASLYLDMFGLRYLYVERTGGTAGATDIVDVIYTYNV